MSYKFLVEVDWVDRNDLPDMAMVYIPTDLFDDDNASNDDWEAEITNQLETRFNAKVLELGSYGPEEDRGLFDREYIDPEDSE